MLYLLAAAKTDSNDLGWCSVASGSSVVFNYGYLVNREHVVVHELGHAFGLVKNGRSLPRGPNYDHIDSNSTQGCWDGTNRCVMTNISALGTNAKFCIYCLLEGSGVVNDQLQEDSLRSRSDRTGP